ncbi:branched-chain amino acid ABC transporter permease [Intrasporangium sp.]|uniref:branched-chain amino acid ABC transporter permease n=1 Tax=Intrasporangium sp. TaxID=1925024 RepID=UPI003221DC7C
MSYILVVAVTAAIFSTVTVSLNIVAGYAGQPNLGQSAIFGIGAYFTAVLASNHGMSFLPNLVVSAVMAAVAGALVGAISLRLREDFFAIVTVGLNFVVVAMFQTIPFFGGATGIYSIPLPVLFGREFGNEEFLITALVLLAFVSWVSWAINRSWLGGMLLTISEDELVASSLGAPVAKYKGVAFVVSSACAGLAGSLYAYFLSAVTPETFGFIGSLTIMAMLIIGGNGTIRGSIVGAVLLTLIPELFRFASEYRILIFGLVLVLVLRFQPQGLVGDQSWFARQVGRVLPRRGLTPTGKVGEQ